MGASGVELLVGVVQGFLQVVAVGLLVSAALERQSRRFGVDARPAGGPRRRQRVAGDRGERFGVLLTLLTPAVVEFGPAAAIAATVHVPLVAEALRTASVTPGLAWVAGGAGLLLAASLRLGPHASAGVAAAHGSVEATGGRTSR